MPSIVLHIDKMTPSTIAIFDRMSDGEWHDNQSLIAFGAPLCAQAERDEALKNGRRVRRRAIASGKSVTDAELIDSGSKDLIRNRLMIAVRGKRLERTKTHHRMSDQMRTAWLALRPGLAAETTTDPDATSPEARDIPPTVTASTADQSAKPILTVLDGGNTERTEGKRTRKKRHTTELVFGGIPEAEGWLTAPLHELSRVHFRTENWEIPLDQFRDDLPAGSEVAYNEGTGLYRVDCAHGTGNEVRDFIRDWCEDRGIKTKSLRAEHNLRRRTLADLNQQFLSDMCVHYAKFAQGRLRRHSTTLQFHFAEKEDETQQVYEWVLDAIGRYDSTSGVPFGAFLSDRISHDVNDLNRSKYGRVLSDTELKHNRALQAFITENGRKPTEHELAALMGQNIHQFRKNAQVVSTLQGLRNMGTLDVAAGDSEVPLPDDEMCDDRHNDEVQQSLLSQILTASCDVDTEARGKLAHKPNVLGWAAWYETLWGQKNKTQLSTGLATSMRNMNEYVSRVQDRMETRQADLLGD